jgi:hypothetical protein
MTLPTTQAEHATVPDDNIRAMLEAFAGPADPISDQEAVNPKRTASRRTLVVLAAAVVTLGLSVPAALALLGQFSQTPQEFIADASQSKNARKVIEQFISHKPGFEATLTDLQRVVTANTPDGEYNVYQLDFTGGIRGTAVISSSTGGIAGMSYGPPQPCPGKWALRAGGGMVLLPGKTPLYIDGQTSDAVASVDVLYPDGHSTPATVSNGYFLAWVIPLPGAPNSRSGFSPPVTLVARDAAGTKIGHLSVRGDGDIPPSPGQPRQAVACG